MWNDAMLMKCVLMVVVMVPIVSNAQTDLRMLRYFLATASDNNNVETLPAPYINVCHKGDPALNQCMMKSVEQIRPYLTRGIPELDIPPIEPIIIGDLIVAESVPGQGVSITAKGVKAYGPSNFILKSLK